MFFKAHTQKEGVFVYHELNIAPEDARANKAETFAGEGKGVMDENKIVPIVNKTNPEDSGNVTEAAQTTAQMVAQHAAIPAVMAVGQSAAQTTGQSAAQVQPAMPAASPSMEQTVPSAVPSTVYAPVESVLQSGISGASGTEPQAGAASIGQPAPVTGSQSVTESSASADTSDHAQKTASDTGYTVPEDERTSRHDKKRHSFRSEPDDDFDFDEDERPKNRFFRFRSFSDEESRDKMILSRIKDEDLMEYLALEQRRLEFLQQAKEAKEKRILIAFQLLISLAAIVGITYLLQDNPTILISILYIVGIIAALNAWRNPHDKGWGKGKK